MTAEIVILNKSAAVLAADSAVTIKTPLAKKTYNSASKIAAISLDPPIGALVYGQADLQGVPWESIKRMYRDHLCSGGESATTTVVDVAEGFFKWLDEHGEWLFGNASQARAARAADAMLNKLGTALDKFTNPDTVLDTSSSDPAQIDEAARVFCRRNMNTFFSVSDTKGPADAIQRQEEQRDAALRQYRDLFDKRIDRHAVVSSLPLSRSTWGEVGRLLADAVCQDALVDDSQETGIAFAGLGSLQFRPELVVYRIHGILNNKVVRSERPVTKRVSGDRHALIEPLGQTAAVEALLQGIHPKYQRRVDDTLGKLPQTLSGWVRDFLLKENVDISEYVTELRDSMAIVINQSLGQLLNVRERNPLPIYEMIADLPTPELVNAAESLVSLTALHQRVGPDIETVGLPVDVAVASRSDGFVWVRRKRYFQPELNRGHDNEV